MSATAPLDIPRCMRRFDSEPAQLGVGKAGKNGALDVAFECGGDRRTVIGGLYSCAPLHAQRALHHDEGSPDMAHLYIMSASGGILQGDRYRIDIALKAGAMAHVATQGATRIYSMNANIATQDIRIRLDGDAYLEFVPDQIIPYRNSRFYQRTSVDVHDSATAVCSEIIAPGRVAMGESFAYDVCFLRFVVAGDGGVPVFIDTANLEPKSRDPRSLGILGGHTVMGSAYIITPGHNLAVLEEKIGGIMSASGGITGGFSRMGGDSGILVRILGDETECVRDAVWQVTGAVREAVTGAAPSHPRRN